MPKKQDGCSVRDQFCEGDGAELRACRGCRRKACGACMVGLECHACLRRGDASQARKAEQHLERIGGSPRRAARKPWARWKL